MVLVDLGEHPLLGTHRCRKQGLLRTEEVEGRMGEEPCRRKSMSVVVSVAIVRMIWRFVVVLEIAIRLQRIDDL